MSNTVAVVGRIEEELSAVVAEAIGRQLDDAPLGDESEDQRAQRLTAHQLVKDALAGGQFGAITVSDLHSFAGGNTAMLVARVNTTLTFVVKVDRSPSLVAEAHHLRSASTDPRLPEATRRAFPQIFAVDDVGPIYGYLMESLEDYTTFASLLVDDDPAMRERVLEVAWNDVLAPAYLATRQKRVIPNVVEDYFVRAEDRLARAVDRGLLMTRDVPLSVRTGDTTFEYDSGWGPLVDRARERLVGLAPPFSTFVHGDPNPENLLWGATEDGGLRVRLIDPKDWGRGDYLFDAAKIGHYLRVTSPVEDRHPAVDVALSGSPAIEYDRDALSAHADLEAKLVDLVAVTAHDQELPDNERWKERYELAVAANLLGIVGPRLERAADGGPATDFLLGWIAFAEGLRGLAG